MLIIALMVRPTIRLLCSFQAQSGTLRNETLFEGSDSPSVERLAAPERHRVMSWMTLRDCGSTTAMTSLVIR